MKYRFSTNKLGYDDFHCSVVRSVYFKAVTVLLLLPSEKTCCCFTNVSRRGSTSGPTRETYYPVEGQSFLLDALCPGESHSCKYLPWRVRLDNLFEIARIQVKIASTSEY